MYQRTIAGQTTAFPISVPNGGSVSAMTAGSDGALWFASNAIGTAGVDYIARMTTSGSTTFFDSGLTFPTTIESIVSGPDGAIWYGSRMTTSGQVSPGWGGGGVGTGLTVGPDRALWYTLPHSPVVEPFLPGPIAHSSFEWASGDFNADGTPDVVWQDPVSGFSQVWFLRPTGTGLVGAAVVSTSNTWRIAAIGDFNGDGHADIVWQDPVSGSTQLWLLGGASGNTILGATTLTGSTSWHIVAQGDFNQDGHPDLVWQDPVSGAVQVWYMGGPQGTTVLASSNLALNTNPTWRVVGAGDFNADGIPDLVVEDPIAGMSQICYMGGDEGSIVIDTLTLHGPDPARIVAVGDFNQDGHADVIFQDLSSGISQLWLLGGPQGTTIMSATPFSGANTWRIVGPR